MGVRHAADEVVDAGDRRDAVEVGLQGLDPGGVDRGGVHGGGIQVAHFLMIAARSAGMGGRLLQQPVDALPVVLGQHGAGAPDGLVGGDLRTGGPPAPGVLGEIGARLHTRVHVGDTEVQVGRRDVDCPGRNGTQQNQGGGEEVG